jgi:hypothetical protein
MPMRTAARRLAWWKQRVLVLLPDTLRHRQRQAWVCMSETKHAGVSADAKRLADSVAKQIAQIGVSEGWMTADRIKGQ